LVKSRCGENEATGQNNDPVVAPGKAFAEVLAMIADAQHPFAPHRLLPIRDADDWLSQSATEFCTALDFYAKRAAPKRKIH
jgi:hypothetical protein